VSGAAPIIRISGVASVVVTPRADPGRVRSGDGRHALAVSQIQRGEAATIEAVARYIEALGGRFHLVATFGDHTLTVATTQAA
jgi:hypothetical protein